MRQIHNYAENAVAAKLHKSSGPNYNSLHATVTSMPLLASLQLQNTCSICKMAMWRSLHTLLLYLLMIE